MHDIIRAPAAPAYRLIGSLGGFLLLATVVVGVLWAFVLPLLSFGGMSTVGIILLSVAFTSFMSGLFGASGGTVLIGILLLVLDVGTAMIVFSIAQGASTIGRAALWRHQIVWSVVARFLVGAVVVVAILWFFAYAPDKAVIYIGLGIMPFAIGLLPKRRAPDISRGWGAYVSGVLVVGLQILAGPSGVVLDVFFQNTNLNRKAVVATKAALQASSLLLRLAYFGSLVTAFAVMLPWFVVASIVAVSVTGTCLAGLVLGRLTDATFRLWGGRIVMAVAVLFLIRGVWLMFAA